MEIAILCILCLVMGGFAGAFLAKRTGRRGDAAPAPVELGYDPENPINGRLNDGKRMVINGVEWTVYGGRQ